MSMNYFQNTMNGVGEKLNFARNTLMGRGKQIRDDKGFSYTADRILTSIGNFMDLGSTTKFSLNDAIANGMRAAGRRNFSASDLASVRDVDVADIAIATTVASHGLTYIAMERAMDSVAQQISFQGLRALNSVGDIAQGDNVVDPRLGFPVGTDFSRDGAKDEKSDTYSGNAIDHTTTAVTFGGPVVVGETKIVIRGTAKKGTDDAITFEKIIAFDPTRNETPSGSIRLVQVEAGVLSGNASVTLGDGSTNGTIKYSVFAGTQYSENTAATGVYRALEDMIGLVSESGNAVVFSNVTVVAVACIDRIAESNGSHTLKLKPYMDSTELVSTENRVILQSSVEVQAQMNKVLRKNAQYGVNVDFGKRAIDQVVALYTYFIDTLIVRKLWEGVGSTVDMNLDLASFSSSGGFNNFVATKNDRLSLFTDSLCSEFLSRTGSPVTALIVDEKAGLMYQSDKESFVADPAINMRRDGLIGTYKGIPVVRNVLLNGKDKKVISGTTTELGTVIGVFKSPDGSAAPVALGDYLPPYSTLPAVNANNPGELSQALFSQTACKCVVPGWAIHGTITPYSI